MRSIDQLVNSMVSKIVMILNLSSDDEVCVAVHKFGSVSQLEVGAICIKVYNILSKFSYQSFYSFNLSLVPENVHNKTLHFLKCELVKKISSS